MLSAATGTSECWTLGSCCNGLWVQLRRGSSTGHCAPHRKVKHMLHAPSIGSILDGIGLQEVIHDPRHKGWSTLGYL